MNFHYLEGEQISEACAERWVSIGWVSLFDILNTGGPDGATDMESGDKMPASTTYFYEINPVWQLSDEVPQ